MARNRKNQSAAVRFGPALKAMMLCLFIGGAGVGYVWQQNQLHDLGQQKKQRELRLDELRLQNSQLARHLAGLRSPRTLQIRARELNLGLEQPRPGQMIRLMDTLPPGPAPTPDHTGQRFAGRQSADVAVR